MVIDLLYGVIINKLLKRTSHYSFQYLESLQSWALSNSSNLFFIISSSNNLLTASFIDLQIPDLKYLS